MSPFSRVLRELRMHRGIRQGDLAVMIGYEQTYISALEIGTKGPPTHEFVDRLIDALSLTLVEEEEIREAARASERKILLKAEMPERVFWMMKKLRDNIDTLHPAQIAMINDVIDMRACLAEAPPREALRMRKQTRTEVTM